MRSIVDSCFNLTWSIRSAREILSNGFIMSTGVSVLALIDATMPSTAAQPPVRDICSSLEAFDEE